MAIKIILSPIYKDKQKNDLEAILEKLKSTKFSSVDEIYVLLGFENKLNPELNKFVKDNVLIAAAQDFDNRVLQDIEKTKIKTIDNDACINMLFALEGAIQGIRWHGLDKKRKAELTEFFNRLTK